MFSASLTFFLITWRRHLLSKNSQSSVRGDEVGKCTVRSACFLVPEAGGMHLTKNSGNFGPKLDWPRSIQPKIRPVGSGKVVHLKRWTSFFEAFPVGPNRSIEFWTEISGNFGLLSRLERHWLSLISAGGYIFQKPITDGSVLRGCQHIRFSPLNVNW